jgi:hypothetical protein
MAKHLQQNKTRNPMVVPDRKLGNPMKATKLDGPAPFKK